jgi:hypothetical protein
MNSRKFGAFLLAAVAAAVPFSVDADGPWASLIPFKRVEADPRKPYLLTEEHGPWLILAATFTGDRAEKQARDLVLELRSRFKLPAYVHKQTYDYTAKLPGRPTPKGDKLTNMRYANAAKYDGMAVLIGNYRSIEDAELEKTLERIKQLRPDCLSKNSGAGQEASSPFGDLKRRVSSAAKSRGPLANAFVTRNPLIPEELFAPKGVDDFVARLNGNVKFSLLDCPGRYTVRIATFRGETTINQREIRENRARQLTDKLEIAADKSHRLTVALRERGVEAYEYHDREESIVTVGSFASEGNLLPNGAIEINPEMYKIVEQYRAMPREIPGRGVAMQPRALAGITFDLQPLPMPVPRRSVAADYARRRVE